MSKIVRFELLFFEFYIRHSVKHSWIYMQVNDM